MTAVIDPTLLAHRRASGRCVSPRILLAAEAELSLRALEDES